MCKVIRMIDLTNLVDRFYLIIKCFFRRLGKYSKSHGGKVRFDDLQVPSLTTMRRRVNSWRKEAVAQTICQPVASSVPDDLPIGRVERAAERGLEPGGT